MRRKQLAEIWILAVLCPALWIVVRSQSQEGFISIDCGLNDVSNYTDSSTRIVYSGDEPYIDRGENRHVSPEINTTGLLSFYQNLRSFPDGGRNCYTLSSVQRGQKYLIRAEFMYGNFDGLNSPPSFDVYLGIHFWDTVYAEFSRLEIIAIAPGDSLEVCLVDVRRGTPYITVLELRPLVDSMYSLANSSHALVLQGDRADYGGGVGSSLRYPLDPFDRIWFGWTRQNWQRVSTNDPINDSNGEFKIPSQVLNTSMTANSTSDSMTFNQTAVEGVDTYYLLHFAEVKKLGDKEVREFDLYVNDSLVRAQFKPKYLSSDSLWVNSAGKGGATLYSLKATNRSTLPPLINAMEVLALLPLTGVPTEESDVNAIKKIREFYKLKNWQGDPCVPKELTWAGLTCSYIGSPNPRIISLNLSHWGINGEISPYIANLTALETLDLSSNNFTGGIPDVLARLTHLKILNCENNPLNGQVPLTLLDKSKNNSLSISVTNTHMCAQTDLCKRKTSNNKIIIASVVSASLSLLLVMIAIIAWQIRRRRQKIGLGTSRKIEKNPYSETSQFTYEEVVHMTKNFQQQIGKGSFGIIYRGRMKTGREVVVNMISKMSSRRANNFDAEAKLLTKVHHQNIVTLLGYCSDDLDNVSLVYEFMPHGNLAECLSDKNFNDLRWSIRLKIALDVAQGLDHLHRVCKPPIVHRDVKSANILLGQSFEAKLADFGLYKLFHDDEASFMSTIIAGAPGYLDPEYQQTSTLNEKSDVYSFGVVLLELITGKPSIIDESMQISITSWVKSKIEGADVTSIVDRRLQGDCDITSLWKVLDVVMACTKSRSVERPSMSVVVKELKDIIASVSSQCSPEVDSQDRRLIGEFRMSFNKKLNSMARS